MSALDGFLSTWDKARDTFGSGVPQTGEQFDQSAQFESLQSTVQTAAPGSNWTGTAANAYGAVNTEHARVLGELAKLDRRLAAHVNESANVVANGRQNLDNLRQWVVDAAASVPPGKNRDQLLMPIVQRGLSELTGIVTSSNDELARVAGDITKLGPEWDALKDQKMGGTGEGEAEDDDIQLVSNEEEMTALPIEEQAARDVEDALQDGDQGAAERVNNALDSISPGTPLSPEQNAYLSQMQKQQKDMSVSELKDANERLGDKGNIIADSWQLMSNDDVEITGGAEGPVKGSASQLPDEVRFALEKADFAPLGEYGERPTSLYYGDRITDIADIVKDGDPKFQTGTELDRQLILAADRVMDAEQSHGGLDNGRSTAQALFEAVDDDHQIVNDHLMGRNGVDVDDFLHDVNTIDWQDDGKAAGYLFSWTNEDSFGTPEEAERAAETAERYAEYLGVHRPDLLDIDGQTLGQLNPELTQRYAHGLVPFVDDMGGMTGSGGTFEIDGDTSRHDGLMPNAKGVFAVLNTDADAADLINSTAYDLAMKEETAFAMDAKDPQSQAHLEAAATMRGLVDVGAHEAFQAFEANGHQAEVNETQWKKNGFDAAVAGLGTGGSMIPGVGVVAGPTIAQVGAAFGQELFENAPPPVDRPLPQMAETRASTVLLESMLAANQTVSLPEGYVEGDPPRIVQPDGVSDGDFATAINQAMGDYGVLVDGDGADEIYADRYNLMIQDPDIVKTPSADEGEG
ncbi:hypothetical protein ASE48_21915 [Mycobacterium sp. Root265]|uniref:TPR repeat region-containing protein n=1 Tax=Mycobacterium sp. Root265 TaxID=1736504 RepID=UPI0007099AA0|nr:EspA/EspE family type VII secretion system effector [Mycobacterium sp. Root265]KRD19697.1 hypothetical protein ASE48_21915 [Mycobacterium sp. Root265]